MRPAKKKVDYNLAAIMNTFGANIEESADVEWNGDCLICGGKKKVWVNTDKQLFDCKVCGATGNVYSFYKLFHAACAAKPPGLADWLKLSESRGIPKYVLEKFGLVRRKSEWYLPIRGYTGNIVDLRRYALNKLLSAKGSELSLWNADSLKDLKKPTTVWWCEGEWDGMAVWWFLEKLNMLDDNVVVAVPGAVTLKPAWMDWIKGHHVIALYDNDEAGIKGERKVAERFKGIAKSVKYVHWPASKPNGYDARDYITQGFANNETPENLLAALKVIIKNSCRFDMREGAGEAAEALSSADAINFEGLLAAFEKRMKMTTDLRQALHICAAVCLSIDIPGDPIWLYLVGAPGFGKTMILGSTADSERCVLRSTVTAHSFVSGWRGEGANDPSLIPKLVGKTFVCKDFTEILTMPKIAQDEVFSTLRGAYDGVVQKTFGNGVTREYKDCRFALLAGVTHSINGHKQSSMGERFLKFQMRRMEGKQTEDVIDAAIASVGNEATTEAELRDAFTKFLLNKIDIENLPTFADRLKNRLRGLVQLIAFLRAQVERNERTNNVIFRPEPEAGTRLAKQLTKLGMCLAVVKREDTITEETYNLLERVALDTAVGFHLDIVDIVVKHNGPIDRESLGKLADISYGAIGSYLEDLIMLKIVIETKQNDKVSVGRPKRFYHLTPTLERLWKQTKGMQTTLKLKRSRAS